MIAKLLESLPGFEAGYVITRPMEGPPAGEPSMYHQVTGRAPSPPPAWKVREYQMEEIRARSRGVGREKIERVDFGPYRHMRKEIIEAARSVEAAKKQDYNRERELLAVELADSVAGRSMEIVQSGFLRPVVAPVVSFGAEPLVTHFRSILGINPTLIGVAAGEAGDESEAAEEEREKEEGAGSSSNSGTLNLIAF